MTRATPLAYRIAPGSSIAALLKHSPLPALEMRILLGHALQLSRVQLITQSERALSSGDAQRLVALVERRLQGEPIAYIVGAREFYGLDLLVSPAVLIPRPETELLVELALARLPTGGAVLDMGTGSGAIAVALAHARPDAKVSALDASSAALELARQNAARHRVDIRWLHSDWYAALARERFDLIVANPPYIRDQDVHLAQGDLRFEPAEALTDFADGLTALRAIAAGAADHLNADGWLLMEHGYDQAEAVRALLDGHGFGQVQSWHDLAGIARVAGGCRPNGEPAASPA